MMKEDFLTEFEKIVRLAVPTLNLIMNRKLKVLVKNKKRDQRSDKRGLPCDPGEHDMKGGSLFDHTKGKNVKKDILMTPNRKKYKYIVLLALHFFFITASFLSTDEACSSDKGEVLSAFDFAELGEYDEAIRRINTVLVKEPNNSQACFVKGYIHQKLLEYDLAIQSYTAAIDLNKTKRINALAYSGRGNCWKEKGVFYRAVSDFTKVIELEPTNTLAYFDRAQVWITLEEFQAAIKDYTTIILINPSEIDAYAKRATLFLKKGKWELALRDLKQIIALDAKNPQVQEGVQ